MLETLGAKIGEGATADVHAWTTGRVIKLYRRGVPSLLCTHEARMTRAACQAGAAAPEVFDEVTLDGRPGLIMARFDGRTLMQAIRTKDVSYAEAGAILAGALHAVHAMPPPPDMPCLRDHIVGGLRSAHAILTSRASAGILSLLDRMPPGDGLCHGDPNPGNVIMTTDGPKLIDWTGAMRAPAALDLASAQVLLAELAPSLADDPERPRAINAAMQAAYAELAGMSAEALAASAEPYRPLVRARLLLAGAVPAHEARLVQQLEADFPQ